MARTIRPANVSRNPRLLVLVILAVITAGLSLAGSDAPAAQAAPTPNGYTLVQDVTAATFARMVDFALIPGTTDQAIVVSQQEARVRRVSLTGAFTPADYGNLSDRVKVAGNEEGLLSAAFSPNFVSDGRIYVYYTSLSCTAPATRCARISRFQVVSNVMVTGVGGETIVLEIPQLPSGESNHNGGRILFGPNEAGARYLYLSIGDGGGGGDPNDNGQDKTELLGSVLRINVTGQTTYTIPPGNPFADGPGGNADEIYAYGVRNPWRYSFDRVSGDLWLGDVGQGAWEEVDKIIAGGNYGWDCYEGDLPFNDTSHTEPCIPPFQFPRAVYSLSGDPCAVVGGYIYRGTLLPEIYGWYVYGDNCSGQIWAVNPADTSLPVQLFDAAPGFNIGSFAELPNGELLVLRIFQPLNTQGIYRLTCAAIPDTDADGQGNACDLDDDNDTWSDAAETTIGTDPLDRCANTPAANDEADDRWPADITDDRFVDTGDLGALTNNFGDAVPVGAPPRHDVSPDPPLAPPNAFIDTADLGRLTNLFGVGCVP